MKPVAGCLLLLCLGCGSGAAESTDQLLDAVESEFGGESSEESAARKADALLTERTVARERFLQQLDELDYQELSRLARPLPKSKVEELGFEPEENEIAQKVRIALTTENRVHEILAATGAAYPMALLSGRNLREGRVVALPTDGASFQPQQVALASDPPLDGELPKYTPRDAAAFRADVLDSIHTDKPAPSDDVRELIEITYSAGQVESSLGTKLGFLDFAGAAEFASGASAKKPLLCLVHKEAHFTLSPAQEPQFKDWFADPLDSGLAAAWLRDLPVYVDRVQYGKLVLILALVESDPELAKSAINEAFLVQDGNLSPGQQEVFRTAQLRLFVHGGDAGADGKPLEYNAGDPAAFDEFRQQARRAMSPSRSLRHSEPIGFTVKSLELSPHTISLICASHAVFEKNVPRPYEVYIRPLQIRIGQAGDDPDHKRGDFHAAVKLAGHVVQSGHLPVRIPASRAENTPAPVEIPGDRIRGPFRVESRSGELAAMLGESDSGPDAREIAGWPVAFHEGDPATPRNPARRWDESVSILNQTVPFDLGEILTSGDEVQIDQRKLRGRKFTIERSVAEAGSNLKNAFTFEILVAVPRDLTERKKEQLLRD